MKNQEVAELLFNIADMLDLLGVAFKPQAYRKAARAIENLSGNIEDYYKRNKLEEIPGVGKGIAEKITEFLETGRSSYYKELKRKVPEGVAAMIEVPGMGPKKAMILYKKLGIKSISDLEKAARHHKIRLLKGFGGKTEQDILKGIELLRRGHERFLLGIALPIAEEIVNDLRKLREVEKISIAGSTRRMKETVGDLDILVVSKNPEPIMDHFTSMDSVARVLAKGSTKSSVLLENNLQVDLRVIPEESFGAALQYFTGSKDHNIALREICKKKGWKLSEYGLFDKNNRIIAGRTEEDVYKKLGMQFIPPEMRENTGEIEAAIEDKLPELVTLDDIRGDLHVHTDYSHAIDPLEEMVEKAVKMGHQYMAITDHSQSLAIAQGLSEEKLMQQIEEIRRLDEEYSEIKLLAGTECDIKSDGSLDYNDEVLEQLDWVVASIHTGMQQDEATITNRIVEAIKNPYTRVIGHPTGRLIQRRNPYPVDLDAIFKAAAEEKVFMEINCSPSRLDLRDVDARRAKEADVKLVLGSDAHSVSQLEFLPLGVAVARRGWLGVDDVVNTWSLDKAQGYRK